MAQDVSAWSTRLETTEKPLHLPCAVLELPYPFKIYAARTPSCGRGGKYEFEGTSGGYACQYPGTCAVSCPQQSRRIGADAGVGEHFASRDLLLHELPLQDRHSRGGALEDAAGACRTNAQRSEVHRACCAHPAGFVPGREGGGGAAYRTLRTDRGGS